MAGIVYLDTHVVAWLYSGLGNLLPTRAERLIEEYPLRISPMVVVELEYLLEVEKTAKPASEVIEALAADVGLEVCGKPFAAIVSRALNQRWTRDPFDRIIVGQAAFSGAPLITKDRLIRDHYPRAVWD
jgi:PIN domain nuclease of toxin-antitoxin system